MREKELNMTKEHKEFMQKIYASHQSELGNKREEFKRGIKQKQDELECQLATFKKMELDQATELNRVNELLGQLNQEKI